MGHLTNQVREAVNQPKVDLWIGSCRTEGSGFTRNFSHKENVLLCLDLLDEKHKMVESLTQIYAAKIGCGVAVGDNSRCHPSGRCKACDNLRNLIADLNTQFRFV